MKRLSLVSLFAGIALTACVVTPGPPGSGTVMVSPLPAVVELDVDSYYYQNGYYYNYQNNNWRYSQSKGGPWRDLPRSYWPKEIRYRGKDHDRDRDRDYDRDRGRDYDRDRDYRQDQYRR